MGEKSQAEQDECHAFSLRWELKEIKLRDRVLRSWRAGDGGWREDASRHGARSGTRETTYHQPNGVGLVTVIDSD